MRHGMDLNVFRQGAHSASPTRLARQLGEPADLVDFGIPCNPYFPTGDMFTGLARRRTGPRSASPADPIALRARLAAALRFPPENVAMANGSAELIACIDDEFVTDSLATPIPTFGRWTDQSLESGKRADTFPLLDSEGFGLDVDRFVEFVRARGSRVAVICNPNNPDGGYLPRREVIRLMDALADLDLIVVDESFLEFVDSEQDGSVTGEAIARSNVLVVNSLGHTFGLHGIRFSYAVGNAVLVEQIIRRLPRSTVHVTAETVVHMFTEHRTAYRESLRTLAADRGHMLSQLSRITGLHVYSSQANFVLVKLPDGCDSAELRHHLISRHGVFVGDCGNTLGLADQFIRLVVRPRADIERLLEGLLSYLRAPRARHRAGSDVVVPFQSRGPGRFAAR